MAEPKHTPWTVGHENCGGGFTIVDSRGCRIAHTTRVVVAGKELVSEDEARENGRLMAAAPEMRAALRDFRRLISRHIGDEWGPCKCGVCAALTRAEQALDLSERVKAVR